MNGKVENIFHNSGVQTLATDVTYCKIGNVVQLTVGNKGISSTQVLGALPTGYRPAITIRTPNQDCKGNLVVGASGSVELQRNEGVSGTVYFVGTTCVFPAV